MGFITKVSCQETKAPKTKLLLCLIFGVLFLAAVVLTILMDPIVMIAKFCARVDYGTLTHEAMANEIDSVHVSAYLFNITNAEQFLRGEDKKLKVQEVGPFTYQENRTNEGLEIDHEAGVIRYTPRHHVTFLPDESVGDPKDMVVTMPNMAMLAMGSLASSYGYLAKFGFNMLTNQLNSKATVTMNAYDYLWGYDEPLIKLGYKFLPGWIHFDKLGLLDRLYDKNASMKLEVSSREDDKFMIKTSNGVGGLKAWDYERPESRSSCNSFTDAYEGLAYPPEMTPDRHIKIYRNVLCRFLELDYHGMKTMDFGVEGLEYRVSNRSYTNDPVNQCLCSKGICHEGISDLSPCFYGLPLVLSNAHFLDADPEIYERIEGMTPNEEEHGSSFVIEPTIGMVMATKFSVQVSVKVSDVGFSSQIDKFSNMIVPVASIKIVQPKMQDNQITSLKLIHIYGPYLLLGLQIVLFIVGFLLLSCSARLLYWNWINPKRKGVAYTIETKDFVEVCKEPLMSR